MSEVLARVLSFTQLLVEKFLSYWINFKSKGAGLDKIPKRIIREGSDLISPYITIIFNLSLPTGLFPDDWESSKVAPIFKQGDKCDMNNYRPISVISAVAKVFEGIVYNQLFSCLNELTFSPTINLASDLFIQRCLLHLTPQKTGPST